MKSRGVDVPVLHAATGLRLDRDGLAIDAIDMVEQAALAGDDYDPWSRCGGCPAGLRSRIGTSCSPAAIPKASTSNPRSTRRRAGPTGFRAAATSTR